MTGANEINKILLPCPFCGGKAYVRREDLRRIYVTCGTCYIRTSIYVRTPAMVDAWNRRVGAAVSA